MFRRWRSVVEQVEDLRLDGDVESRGRLVGDEQLRLAGQGHGDHHPLAQAAGELVGIGAQPLVRAGACRRASSTSRARSCASA